jgi:hypothetical protein
MPSTDLPQEAAELLRSASRLLHSASRPLRGASQPLHSASQPLHSASQPLSGVSQPVRGASQPASAAGTPADEALGQLVRLAASQVTGCSGASATLWQDGEPAVFAASHPDLAELAMIERSSGGGPVTEARATGKPVCTPDTLDDDRWPAYSAAALARGVRSSITLVHQDGPMMVTLSLFGARPGRPGRAGPPGAIGS